MPGKIVIIGAGFAGVWSALAAKRLFDIHNRADAIDILVISPEPHLAMRPRFYESDVANMKAPLTTLFKSTGIRFLQGTAETIDTDAHVVRVKSQTNASEVVPFDRLILAAGSAVVRPNGVSGLQQHAFDIDTLEAAAQLEEHIENLSSRPASTARDTVVVCGAGFTGIEIATELPRRLQHLPNARVVLVESADELGPELGPGPRPVIAEALNALGVVVKLGSAVSSVDAWGVTLQSGDRIETLTPVWTAGMRATPLTQHIPGAKDSLSRVHVDSYLRSPACDRIFVTGDAARAATDDKGHDALMSCQHAMQLGRISGHNAAADILGEPLIKYSQQGYNCCLDLGSHGAVVTRGWEREVLITGEIAKKGKNYINQRLIYPPSDAREAIQAAGPAPHDTEEVFAQILATIG
jgi:NADH dehydrogenase FAD-containing subunit